MMKQLPLLLLFCFSAEARSAEARSAEPGSAEKAIERYRAGNALVSKYTDAKSGAIEVKPLLHCEDFSSASSQATPEEDLTKQGLSHFLDPKFLSKVLGARGPVMRSGNPLIDKALKDIAPVNGDAYSFLGNLKFFQERRIKEFNTWADSILLPAIQKKLNIEIDSSAYVCADDLGNLQKDLKMKARIFERLSGRIGLAHEKPYHSYYEQHAFYIEEIEIRNYVTKYLIRDRRKWYQEGSICNRLAEQVTAISEGYAEQLDAAKELSDYLNSQADSLKALAGKLEKQVKDCGSLDAVTKGEASP